MADATDARAELAATLALAQVPGIGAARLRTLRRVFGGTRAGLRAPYAQLKALPGYTPAAATAVATTRLEHGERILAELDRLGARVLLADDADFPPLLREVHEPPPLLYVWGQVALLSRPAVAIVGSRQHTAYGAEAARHIASGVARAAVVVSGMARGIDAIAHEAALDAGGGSIGVLGNGFGVIYPAANRALYERMRAAGCLVTELAPGERPSVNTFPRRNRLISGLARATVVVEAAPKSGALITAEFALDQGRDVLVVPGPITSATSLGANRLLLQGAKPALCAADVLEEIDVPVPPELRAEQDAPRTEHGARSTVAGSQRAPCSVLRAPPSDLPPLHRTLWDALAPAPRHVDELADAAGEPAALILTTLTDLELRGLVVQRPGMRFALAPGPRP